MPDHLPHLSGEMVHPRGRITSKLHFDGEQVHGTVSLPDGLRGTFRYGGKIAELQPGTQSIEL